MSQTIKDNGATVRDETGTGLSLLGSHGLPAGSVQFPRLSIDAVAGSVTLGGSLLLASFEGSGTVSGTEVSSSVTTFGISPRVGLWVPVAPSVKLWPRGGLTYVSQSNDTADIKELWLTFEPALVVALSEGIGLSLAGTLDHLATIAATVDGEDATPTQWTSTVVGLQAGLSAWF
jgi:hypothetical protein